MQNKPRQQINAKEKVLNILKRIKLSHNKVDISCDDFGILQDEYFSIILPILFKSNEKKTDRDISLIFGYFLYLNDFISAITNLSKD